VRWRGYLLRDFCLRVFRRISDRDDEHRDAGEDDYISRGRAGCSEDEPMKPSMLILALKKIVEDDFQRSGFQQAGNAFACNCQQPEPQLATVGPQQFEDVQTTPGVHCPRLHESLDANLSTSERA
jgi:hypothetical protein